jgi:tyrosinase
VSNGPSPRLRKSIDNLGGAELAALRDAYGKMMAISDNRGWAHYAGFHGIPEGDCWHHGRIGFGDTQLPYDLFLPWHRAYLTAFELAVRDQNAAATVPWWDWSSPASDPSGIPKAFADPTLSGGAPNPLASAPIPPYPDLNPFTRRFPGQGLDSDGNPVNRPFPVSPDDVTAVLGLTSFPDFTEQVQNLHDGIHGWVGGMVLGDDGQPVSGEMGSIVASAYDPIFWSHHCMIDRLWYLWQLRNGVDEIPPNYLDMSLSPFPLQVKDVLNITSLGYEYASSSVTIPARAGGGARRSGG